MSGLNPSRRRCPAARAKGGRRAISLSPSCRGTDRSAVRADLRPLLPRVLLLLRLPQQAEIATQSRAERHPSAASARGSPMRGSSRVSARKSARLMPGSSLEADLPDDATSAIFAPGIPSPRSRTCRCAASGPGDHDQECTRSGRSRLHSKQPITTLVCSSIASASFRASSTSGTSMAQASPTAASTMTIDATATTFVLVDTRPPGAHGPPGKRRRKRGEAVMTMPMRSLQMAFALAMLVIALPAVAQTPAKKTPAPTAPRRRRRPRRGRSADAAANYEYAPQAGADPFRTAYQSRQRRQGHGAATASAPTASRMLTRADGARHSATRGRVGRDGPGPDGKVYTVRAGDRARGRPSFDRSMQRR